MDLREIGEFGLIQRIRGWMASSDPSLVQGIGDDVAVIRMGSKALLATTDMLVEDIHFQRSWIDPYHLGKKALMVNLSDIAAMGGTPKYFLVSLGLPRNLPLSFVARLYRGMRDGAKQHRVDLVGGDTTLSRKIVLNICLLGEGHPGRIIFRSGAKAGDDLWVSGTLGDAALGLKMLQGKGRKKKPRGLIEKHLSPIPRLSLGQALARSGLANSMIDVSDGLLSDTSHLLEESQVGAILWEDRIPLSTAYRKHAHFYSRSFFQLAFTGGEDYELLFTARMLNRNRISSLSRTLRVPVSMIGKILPKKDGLVVVRTDGGRYTPSRLGFDHFR
jgi:thiamine-monophosphate kinase